MKKVLAWVFEILAAGFMLWIAYVAYKIGMVR